MSIKDSDTIADINRLNKEDFFSFLDGIGHKHIIKLESGRYYLSSWKVDEAIEDFLTNPNITESNRRRT